MPLAGHPDLISRSDEMLYPFPVSGFLNRVLFLDLLTRFTVLDTPSNSSPVAYPPSVSHLRRWVCRLRHREDLARIQTTVIQTWLQGRVVWGGMTRNVNWIVCAWDLHESRHGGFQ